MRFQFVSVATHWAQPGWTPWSFGRGTGRKDLSHVAGPGASEAEELHGGREGLVAKLESLFTVPADFKTGSYKVGERLDLLGRTN